jgi:hypothetical protein
MCIGIAPTFSKSSIFNLQSLPMPPSRPFLAIARATLIEAMQQPSALLLLFVSVAVTLLAPLFEFHHFGEEGRLARDGGLACMLLFGLLLAMTAAGSAVARELASGTAAAALAKPVPRGVFLTAKFAGIFALVILFWLSLLLATLLAERTAEHIISVDAAMEPATDNLTSRLALLAPVAALALAAWRHYRRRARVGVTAFVGLPLALAGVALACGCWNTLGQWHPYHPGLNARVVPAAVLVLLALAMCTALAAALATRLTASATVATGALLALLGLAGDTLAGTAPAATPRGLAGALMGGILPNIQNFWLADALARNGTIPWHYVGAAALLAATWCAVALTAGTQALRHRELG